jgi:hypothetical protein
MTLTGKDHRSAIFISKAGVGAKEEWRGVSSIHGQAYPSSTGFIGVLEYS